MESLSSMGKIPMCRNASLNGKGFHLVDQYAHCTYWAWLNHGGGVQGRLMSMQTGSTRGHHLANYHCWHTGADLNCHHKHITPCPNCPAICHRATRRATQHGEDGAEGDGPHDKATWSALQTGHATGPPARLRFGGHSAVSQCQLTVSVTGLTDRCLLCLWHLLPGKDENREDQLAANISRMLPEICQKSKSARCAIFRVIKQFFKKNKKSIKRFTQIHLPTIVNLIIVPNKSKIIHADSMTTKTGVETEDCALAYYWNHLHKNTNLHLLLLES